MSQFRQKEQLYHFQQILDWYSLKLKKIKCESSRLGCELPVQQNVKWSRFEDGTILVSAIWFRFDTNLIIHHSAHTTFYSSFFSSECKCRQKYFHRILSLCKQTLNKQHLFYLTFRWRQFRILDLGWCLDDVKSFNDIRKLSELDSVTRRITRILRNQ